MTTLYERTDPGDSAEPVVPSGTAVALEAAGTGLVGVALVVLLAWATDSRSAATTGEALRVAAQGWLLAHHVPLAVEGGRVGLVPGGLALLPLLLLARAGAGLARVGAVARPRDLRSVAACLALPYAACAGVVALLARTDAAAPPPVVAALAAGAHAVVAGGTGAALQAGLLPGLLRRLPAGLRDSLRAGLLACALVLGAASLLVAAALALSFGEATALARQVAPGSGGAVGLLLLGLAVVPNAVVWAAAYLLGPGLSVGAGTSVTVAGATLAHVPALPLLAVLPDPGPAPRAATALLLVPVAAGLLAGRLLTRSARAHRTTADLRRRAGGAGLVAGVGLGGLAAATAGPVGPGLAAVGASWWQVALAATAAVALGALTVVEAAGWCSRRRARAVPDPEVAGGSVGVPDGGPVQVTADGPGGTALGVAAPAPGAR